MALNGLNESPVIQAYQSALSEAGGWFLLKYTSRDAVELLNRGSGGVVEARGAIADFTERSPLYGFLLYRRRKVLIKYIPEGTSRLLQARVAVHFQSITDKFSPHDSTLTISAPDDLNDITLGSACSLHTGLGGSLATHGSLPSRRNNKLDEILEEEGSVVEEQVITEPKLAAIAPVLTVPEPQPPPSTEASTTVVSGHDGPTAPTPTTAIPETEAVIIDTATDDFQPSRPGTARAMSQETIEVVLDSEVRAGANPMAQELTPSERAILAQIDSEIDAQGERRFSSQSARPSLSDLTAFGYVPMMPKVKLGPRPTNRPSLETQRTNSSSSVSHRQISSLPAGLRTTLRKPIANNRPRTPDPSIVPALVIPSSMQPPQLTTASRSSTSPAFSLYHHSTSPLRPKTSPASVRSLPVPLPRSAGMTPEKQRLMRALELRKKQMTAAAAAKVEEEEPETDTVEPVTAVSVAPAAPPAIDETSEQGSDKGLIEAASSLIKAIIQPIMHPENQTVPQEPIVSEVDKVIPEQPRDQPDVPTPSKSLIPSTENPSKPSTNGEVEEGARGDDDVTTLTSSPISAQESYQSSSTAPSSIAEDESTPDAESINNNNFNAIAEPTAKSDHGADKSGDDVSSTSPSDDVADPDQEDSLKGSPTVVPENPSRVPSVLVPSTLGSPALEENDSKEERALSESDVDVAVSIETTSDDSKETTPTALANHKGKQRTLPAPLQLHLNDSSDLDYLSDESFMDELQSATVEEAKPVSVSKSPITPFFPKSRTNSIASLHKVYSNTYNQMGRSPSNPLSPENGAQIVRTPSGTLPPTPNGQIAAKKVNVSSGISRRIKALAENSSRESMSGLNPSATITPNVVASRVSSLRSSPEPASPPSASKSTSSKRWSKVQSLGISIPSPRFTSSPKNTNTAKVVPKGAIQPVYHVKREAKTDTVSVTAKIIRDARTAQPDLSMPTETTPLELHQSPLIIEHQKQSTPPSPTKTLPPKSEATSPVVSSAPLSRESTSINLPRSSSESLWRPFSRRPSDSKSPPSSHSVSSLEDDSKKDDKKSSRTSRLFKRMSSSMGVGSRKNSTHSLTSPTKEMSGSSFSELASVREPPAPVHIGDLNVQFPDNLLWKRRWVEIDVQGNIVLSLSKPSETSRGITKRYHLSEFNTPYAPDQERQELPYSVVFDFVDGRMLQCACEDLGTQTHVLQVLKEAHTAWITYAQ